MALNRHLILFLADVKYKVGAFTLLFYVTFIFFLGMEISFSPAFDFFSQLVVPVSKIDLFL
jgi:hypothetical protein